MDLSAVPWESLDVKEWMIEFRRAVKIRSYALIYEIRRAMLVFEDTRKTNYSHYHSLESVCSEIWEAWRLFAEMKEVNAKVLEASPVFLDMQRIPSAMTTPRGTRKKKLMGEIRVAARAAIRDMDELRGMIDEFLHRLQEEEDDEDERGTEPSNDTLPGIRPILKAPTPLEALSIGPEQAKWEVCSHSK